MEGEGGWGWKGRGMEDGKEGGSGERGDGLTWEGMKGGILNDCAVFPRFLHSLEESACSEEDPDEGSYNTPPFPSPIPSLAIPPSYPPDLDVTHLQLMLFVWHSFSFETRASLLTSCAQAVVKAGMAKQ